MSDTDTERIQPDATARMKLLDTLSNDLTYEGWDLPCKLWVMLGDNDDPYLEFVGNYEMDPDHWFMHRAQEGVVKDQVTGLVTCWEAWAYPEDLSSHFEAHRESGAMALAGYAAIIGPQDHPDRLSLRTIHAVCRDGAVLRIEHYEDGRKKPDEMTDHPLSGEVGQELTDLMRAVLGISTFDPNPLSWISGLPELKEIIAEAEAHEWSTDKIGAELYKRAPDHLKPMLADTMPDSVRELLDKEESGD